MAPSKTKSAEKKQATLSFNSSKRTASVSNAAKKSSRTNKSSVLRRATTDVPISISSSSSSEDEGVEVEVVERKKGVAEQKKKKSSDVLLVQPPEAKERPNLRPRDPRWKSVLALSREKNGNHRPIHGEGENVIHEILHVFDMSYEYGPCIGVTRLERWERAEALGLNPPVEIRDILLTRQGVEQTDLAQCALYEQV